jgi:hypothetical protein
MKWFKKKNPPLPEDCICSNCGAQTIGKYCHECGQNVFAGKEQPITHLFGQMLENAFSLDAKTPRTLFFLMFRPGFLSTEYRAGRISRYVHPVKLFWMATLILFALMVYQLSFNKKDNREIIHYESKTNPNSNSNGLNIALFQPPDTQQIPSTDEDPEVKEQNQKYERILVNFLSKYAPYISFLLIPIFAFLLALFFWRKKYYYISHLTFTVHFHTFLWIFCSVLMLIDILTHWIYPQWLAFLLLITPGIYFAIALHRYYKTKTRWQAVWKAILIMLLYFILILMVVTLIIIIMAKAKLFDLDL